MANLRQKHLCYRIYLLTFWLEDAVDLADPETWRFRLEEPKSGHRYGCVGVTDLAANLIRAITNDADTPETAP